MGGRSFNSSQTKLKKKDSCVTLYLPVGRGRCVHHVALTLGTTACSAVPPGSRLGATASGGGTDSRTESPARNGPAQPYPCCRVSGKWLPAWHQLTSIATRALPCQLVVTTVVTGAPSIPGCHRRRVVAVKQRVHDGFRFVRIAPPGRCVVVRADGAYGG
jgi:hypothetical protein